MNNERLKEWNDVIADAKREKVARMEDAMRRRGWKRRINLFFAKVFAWIERNAKEGRRDDM